LAEQYNNHHTTSATPTPLLEVYSKMLGKVSNIVEGFKDKTSRATCTHVQMYLCNGIHVNRIKISYLESITPPIPFNQMFGYFILA
jgi:hypothetical protein